MSAAPVRIGLVGAGAIAQVSHLPAFARIPGIRVAAVCDEDRGKAERVAARYTISRVSKTFDDPAFLDEVDAVDICLPNHLHAPAALAALRAGKHVLVERPFCRSEEEAAEVVQVAAKAGLVAMSGMNNRFREDARVLKRFVAGGELGAVFFAKAGWLMHASSWSGSSWRKQKEFAGGGVLFDLGMQMLDTALWVMDMPAVTAVSASAHPVPRGDELESTAAGFLRLDGGRNLSLEVSWGLQMERDFAYLNLFGDQGAALLNPLRIHKEMHGSLVNVTPELGSPRNAYKHSYENEIQHFVDCVRDGATCESPGSDSLRLHGVLKALYTSAVEGSEVPVG